MAIQFNDRQVLRDFIGLEDGEPLSDLAVQIYDEGREVWDRGPGGSMSHEQLWTLAREIMRAEAEPAAVPRDVAVSSIPVKRRPGRPRKKPVAEIHG
jgi:hypothetical protein